MPPKFELQPPYTTLYSEEYAQRTNTQGRQQLRPVEIEPTRRSEKPPLNDNELLVILDSFEKTLEPFGNPLSKSKYPDIIAKMYWDLWNRRDEPRRAAYFLFRVFDEETFRVKSEAEVELGDFRYPESLSAYLYYWAEDVKGRLDWLELLKEICRLEGTKDDQGGTTRI